MSVISLAGFSSSEGGRIITLPRSMFLHWGSTITPRPPAAPVTIHFVCVFHTPKPYFPLESVCMQYGIPYSTARTHTQAAGFFTLYSSVGQIHEYIDEYVDCSPVVEQNILILSWDTRRQIMKWFILADSMASSSEWLQLLQNTVLFFQPATLFSWLKTKNIVCCRCTWGEVGSSFLTVGAICACLAKTLAFCPGENWLAIVGARSTLAGIKLIQVLQEGLPQVSPLCDSTWDPPNQINDG